MINQIIKLQRDKKHERVIKIQTKNWYGHLLEGMHLEDGLALVFENVLVESPEIFINWQENKKSLTNLTNIIKKDFKIKIFEDKYSYTLIVSKNTCSASFKSTKEQGIAHLLMQAEEWAETLLEDLKGNTSCGV